MSLHAYDQPHVPERISVSAKSRKGWHGLPRRNGCALRIPRTLADRRLRRTMPNDTASGAETTQQAYLPKVIDCCVSPLVQRGRYGINLGGSWNRQFFCCAWPAA